MDGLEAPCDMVITFRHCSARERPPTGPMEMRWYRYRYPSNGIIGSEQVAELHTHSKSQLNILPGSWFQPSARWKLSSDWRASVAN